MHAFAPHHIKQLRILRNDQSVGQDLNQPAFLSGYGFHDVFQIRMEEGLSAKYVKVVEPIGSLRQFPNGGDYPVLVQMASYNMASDGCIRRITDCTLL